MEAGCKVVSRKGKTLDNLLSPNEFVENKSNTWLFHLGDAMYAEGAMYADLLLGGVSLRTSVIIKHHPCGLLHNMYIMQNTFLDIQQKTHSDFGCR